MSHDLSAVRALCEETGCEARENEPMRLHTTFRIGGPADLFVVPDSPEQIARLLPAIRCSGIPLYLMGRGSNLLVRDEGVRGVVVALTPKLARMELCGETEIFCGAGASLESLCRFAQEQGLQGLEFAYGIPGSVGGAVYMNAGAYGGEMKDVLISADHIGLQGDAGMLSGPALGLSYRHSAYMEMDCCITGATVRLSRGDPAQIRARMDEYKRRRREKQPLEYPSAGSTFKRPQGSFASALIDGCGLKGLRVGGAMVSEKHAGFVINRGDATCAQVLELISRVRETVEAQTGYRLDCEVRVW